MKILLLSDIHGNYPALQAVSHATSSLNCKYIFNCGDSLVYAPFPNETIDWLRRHEAISIRGNTDDKVIKLLKGKTFKKPSKHEKRIMYFSTAAALSRKNVDFLLGLKKKKLLCIDKMNIGLFHGSPADHNEFLFADTQEKRFMELAQLSACQIVVIGHSHTPFHKEVAGVHFINPGSVGRMFDGSSDASYAVLDLEQGKIEVKLYRCPYDVESLIQALAEHHLPAIYQKMYRTGTKCN